MRTIALVLDECPAISSYSSANGLCRLKASKEFQMGLDSLIRKGQHSTMSAVQISNSKPVEHGLVSSILEHRLQELGDILARRVLNKGP
jgi:hypothetical protein